MSRAKMVVMTTFAILMTLALSAQENKILPTAPLRAFETLHIDAQMSVNLVQIDPSEPQRIVYELGDNDFEKFKFSHKSGGVLSVTFNTNAKALSPASATIYFHNMKSLVVRSAIVVVEDFEGVMTDVKVDYKGSLEGNFECDDLALSAYADSRVEITGDVRYLTVEAGSRAKVELRSLDATSANIVTSSGAVVAIKAMDRLETRIGSNSIVKYWGEPNILRNHKMIMGGSLIKQ